MKSEVPRRDASRSPSRPNAFPAVAPVVRIKLVGLMAGRVVANGVTEAGATLPL